MRQLKIEHKITNRESLSLEKYLSDISKIDLLTPDQEFELATKIRNGDADALEKMTKSNLRFVVSVAKQYQHQGLSLSDLINEGNVGLMKAAKRFDETKGFKFISYAVWWIRQSILQAIVEYSRIVRLPVNKVTSLNKLQQVYASFIQEFEREPTIGELSELLEIDEEQVGELMNMNNRHISFDSPLGDEEDDFTLLDTFVDTDIEETDDQLIKESLIKDIDLKLNILSPREKEILKAFYGLNGSEILSLEEIGEMFELSGERVRQIKERAILKLRKSYNRYNMVL
ncbi:MAG: RNA polymerase sigma factor RpoD/SigA [Saprospiraceae bacterium]